MYMPPKAEYLSFLGESERLWRLQCPLGGGLGGEGPLRSQDLKWRWEIFEEGITKYDIFADVICGWSLTYTEIG